jgi:hypothetical protein
VFACKERYAAFLSAFWACNSKGEFCAERMQGRRRTYSCERAGWRRRFFFRIDVKRLLLARFWLILADFGTVELCYSVGVAAPQLKAVSGGLFTV